MTESDVFAGALKCATPTDRVAYLDRACPDPKMRQLVDELLQHHDAAGDFLEKPTGPGVGTVINGRYKLLELIGEGGMGRVFMAEQIEPVRRRVAVKVISAGASSGQVLARFEAERQALALMDHPNIAKVLDAGSITSQNPAVATAGLASPFFVMELVKGVPITQFCDERRLTPRERLELFIPVCQAVQHAHQKGVIHRDLKPSNVMVALYDDRPVPKIIDFGIAKATGERLTERTLFTGYGTVVGTPEYMSPEQAAVNQIDIDARSDIYSLGVLLYELLTGSTPVGKRQLGEAALLEVLRIIREEEPPRPSTKLKTSLALPSIAANRHTEPAKLPKLIRGDLDWVVMKALEKDRDRRYPSANGLAHDLQRFLANESVRAGPPGRIYRLRRYVRRHRGFVVASGIVLMLLGFGVLFTGLAFTRARMQQLAANDARMAALMERDRAESEAQRAAAASAEANAVRDFVQRDLLGQAAVRQTIADTFRDLGELKSAREQAEKTLDLRRKTLGNDHPDTLAAGQTLAGILVLMGEFQKAEALYREVLAGRTKVFGPDHNETINTLRELGVLQVFVGKHTEAEALFRRVIAAKHEDDVAQERLAYVYRVQGKYAEAEQLLRDVITRQTTQLGKDHPLRLRSLHQLAQLYIEMGKRAEGTALLEEVLTTQKAKLGEDHPDTLATMHDLARAYQLARQRAKALALLEEVVKKLLAKLGPDHPRWLSALRDLGMCHLEMNQHDRAKPLLEELVSQARQRLGADHPETLSYLRDYATVLERSGQAAKAEPLRRELLEKARPRPNTDLASLGANLAAQKKWADAEPILRQALAAHKATDWRALALRSSLGQTLAGLGKHAEAEPLLRTSYAGLREQADRLPLDARFALGDALERLIDLLTTQGKAAEVEALRKQRMTAP